MDRAPIAWEQHDADPIGDLRRMQERMAARARRVKLVVDRPVPGGWSCGCDEERTYARCEEHGLPYATWFDPHAIPIDVKSR